MPMTKIAYLAAFLFAADASVLRRQDDCANQWDQCGGLTFTGPKCCKAGFQCVELNPSYSQCLDAQSMPIASQAPAVQTTRVPVVPSPSRTTTRARTSPAVVITSAPNPATSPAAQSPAGPPGTPIVSAFVPFHTQAPYPVEGGCGSWAIQDGVCCPVYCTNDNRSESCGGCGGTSSSQCVSPPSRMCKSGNFFPEVHSVSDDEPFHYSRSTHFGLTYGGACGFGLYGLCTNSFTNFGADHPCSAFCTAYPTLCKDPSGTTLRGNFAAPNGDYYTQFWSSLQGDRDNYLSCGECFEVIRTKADGTDYAPGEDGYTVPIVLEILDSCPCSANSKWCCGPRYDHCGEVSHFKYGCPLPEDSIHLDLSDIAMSRLQTGDANGNMVDGVIPTRYRRVRCPKPGNAYIWLRTGGGPYYFALTVVNTAGVGSVVNVEISTNSTDWTRMIRDPNYSSSRPQERYGAWVMPQGSGPFNPPIAMRITGASGEVLTNMEAIKAFTPPTGFDPNFWYIDFEQQFTL